MKSEDRNEVQEEWTAGVFPVIVATPSFGAGIEKFSVRFVCHWDVPQSLVGYYKVVYCKLFIIVVIVQLKRLTGIWKSRWRWTVLVLSYLLLQRGGENNQLHFKK